MKGLGKNFLISLMVFGAMYQVGINELINFPKDYPKDHLIVGLSIAFCALMMTYHENQVNHGDENEKIQ